MPVIPDPARIASFPDARAFERWLAKHHKTVPELYLRIYKKGSGKPTVTYAEALDVALCWGWIDGLKKSYDADSFLQRFTPRRPKSGWSAINREHVARLVAAARMTPHGQAHVDTAKADGRWDAAYAGQRTMQLPEDLLAAIRAVPRAQAMFETLDKANRYALAFRIAALKTAEGRAKRIATFVEMLARGETVHPMKAATAAKAVKPPASSHTAQRPTAARATTRKARGPR